MPPNVGAFQNITKTNRYLDDNNYASEIDDLPLDGEASFVSY